MNELLKPKVFEYITRHELEAVELLGSGKDGIVYVVRHKAKPRNVAIKIFKWREIYLREKKAYERLGIHKVTDVLGFNIPKLIGNDDDLFLLEMTIVERPFVLDFAAAYLDARPEFSEEIWAHWELEKREQFEGRWPMVQKIIAAFEELGIYLTDVSPANIGFHD